MANEDIANLVGKERLTAAFFELIEENPITRISVADICAQAGVSRQAFYRHFDSKYAVAQDYLRAEAERSMFRVGRDLNWHDSIIELLEALRASDVDGNRLIAGDVLETAYRCRVESLEATIAEHLGVELTQDLRFQIAFFARAEASLLNDHLSRPDLYNPDLFTPHRFAELLEKCVPQELHDLMESGLDQ